VQIARFFPKHADAFPMARKSMLESLRHILAKMMATAGSYGQAAGCGTGPEIRGMTSESVESMAICSCEPEKRQGQK